jgi:hypothetical protein
MKRIKRKLNPNEIRDDLLISVSVTIVKDQMYIKTRENSTDMILMTVVYLYDKWAEARDHWPAGTIGKREKNRVEHLYLDIEEKIILISLK